MGIEEEKTVTVIVLGQILGIEEEKTVIVLNCFRTDLGKDEEKTVYVLV